MHRHEKRFSRTGSLLELRKQQLFPLFTSSSTDTERNLDPFQQPTSQFCIPSRTHKHPESVYTHVQPQPFNYNCYSPCYIYSRNSNYSCNTPLRCRLIFLLFSHLPQKLLTFWDVMIMCSLLLKVLNIFVFCLLTCNSQSCWRQENTCHHIGKHSARCDKIF